MTQKKVLVTGATGFLGRSVVPRLLRDGWDVTAAGRTRAVSPFGKDVAVLSGDLSKAEDARELLSPWRWDSVVNLAGAVPRSARKGEIEAGAILQHGAIALGIALAVPKDWRGRFVHASSMTVYGLPEALPVTEAHPRKPLDAYGAAKSFSEDVIFGLAAEAGWDAWVLRFPGLFSETRKEGALYHFMRAAAGGRPLLVNAPAPTPWDVLHVEDAAEAVARALKSAGKNPGAVNISYGEPVELEAVARSIARRTGRPVAVENPRKISHPVFQMDISRAKALLGWPPAALEDRLGALWNALREPAEVRA